MNVCAVTIRVTGGRLPSTVHHPQPSTIPAIPAIYRHPHHPYHPPTDQVLQVFSPDHNDAKMVLVVASGPGPKRLLERYYGIPRRVL